MTTIVVHGGAGAHRGPGRASRMAGVETARDAGWGILVDGGSALDAVEAATRVLEDEPLFDAGYGSYLNRDGEVELDAILVDGCAVRFGAVAAVRGVRHPLSLARRVMEVSPHAMLAGAGAEAFAAEQGLRVPVMSLVSPRSLEFWKRDRAQEAPDRERDGAARASLAPQDVSDTVGAVALDSAGRVAAATSTGGTRDKWRGRVGDSPIIGAGAYADNRSGAISCTGHGESIMRICMAYLAHTQLLAGVDAQAVAASATHALGTRTTGHGGLIIVARDGRIGWCFNTRAMPVAWRTGSEAGRAFDTLPETVRETT